MNRQSLDNQNPLNLKSDDNQNRLNFTSLEFDINSFSNQLISARSLPIVSLSSLIQLIFPMFGKHFFYLIVGICFDPCSARSHLTSAAGQCNLELPVKVWRCQFLCLAGEEGEKKQRLRIEKNKLSINTCGEPDFFWQNSFQNISFEAQKRPIFATFPLNLTRPDMSLPKLIQMFNSLKILSLNKRVWFVSACIALVLERIEFWAEKTKLEMDWTLLQILAAPWKIFGLVLWSRHYFF